jgi:Ser/Thr protein kinase RdoA (MazF antagonist)
MLSDADILSKLGAAGAVQLGSGGEASVYRLDGARVARIMRAGAKLSDAVARAELLTEIAVGRGSLPFLTPTVEDLDQFEGRVFSIERELPGEPVSQQLVRCTGSARGDLLQSYFDTAGRLREIDLWRPFFGPLVGNTDLRSGSWSAFAAARLHRSALTAPPDLLPAVLELAARPMANLPDVALVHMDYFPANVLAVDGTVSAVLDFGPAAVMGDARMDAWGAVAYLDSEITPEANEQDREQGVAWLTENGLADDYDCARRWLAASWSFASNDAQLMAWCRRILLTT